MERKMTELEDSKHTLEACWRSLAAVAKSEAAEPFLMASLEALHL